MDSQGNGPLEGFAEGDTSQRRRRLTAQNRADLDEAIHTLKQLWHSELSEPANRRLPYRATDSPASNSAPPDYLSGWKREALGKTVRFPEPPPLAARQEYLPGSLFVPLQFGSSDGSVHLDDYSHFQSLVQKASEFRLRERAVKLPPYPVPEPTVPPFPSGITTLEPRTVPFHWYDYFLADSHLRRRHSDAYNIWLRQLLADRHLYFTHKKTQFETISRDRISQWKDAKSQWDENIRSDKAQLESLCSQYEAGSSTAITEYFFAQLNSIPLPYWCPRDYDLQFDEDAGILLIECQLPYFGTLAIQKTKLLTSGPKLTLANQREVRDFTTQFPYLLALRLMWEIPQVDYRQRVGMVCCNGFVVYDDPATGRRRRDVILSVAARREDIESVRLERVEPEACFRGLKGVAAAKLWELVPVQPLIRFNKNDKRFIAAKDVLSNTLQDTNLATMEWQDFEYLIRDLFEKEFASGGGDVRVTQASRDRGVDAVVFDPDPLRGGKLIIQAKRYTNTVDVSAVRDLYGTVINEGANKGILVTTSNYGRDSYEFAKDKPLILLNGTNLLHLLNKHGYALRIDIEEARQLLK